MQVVNYDIEFEFGDLRQVIGLVWTFQQYDIVPDAGLS